MRHIVHYRQVPLYLPKIICSAAQCDRAVAAILLYSQCLGIGTALPYLKNSTYPGPVQVKVTHFNKFWFSALLQICWKSVLPFVSFPCLHFPVQRMHNTHISFDAKDICVRL